MKLKRLRRAKQRRWKRYCQNRNIVTHADYRDSASNFKSEFLKAKCQYENFSIIKNHVPRDFTAILDKTQNAVVESHVLKMGMTWLLNSDTGKANLFSDYFSSVFVEDNNTLPEFSPDCIMIILKISHVI